MITLHILKRPYLNRKIDYLQLCSEILFLIILLILTLIQAYDYLQSLSLSIDNRIALGWSIVGLAFCMYFIKLGFALGEIGINGFLMWEEWRRKRRRKMEEEEEDDSNNFIEMEKCSPKQKI
jgi:hypothetical protein